ncbi:MAG: protein-methionine-sulfoxide reductase heme-binding subunit MsrQ [Pseudomonadota bacterium]|nr:protein-methionine-sulfoxide reductase heme-binding subunit MsrQ [Pseudomonadota bacterium]MEC7269901.1 protein-methionine-sulfoxide reductase heme-binding subunit MsrQ [Pseudomonadota bacterium]MEC8287559.1 protein-methionine-sulfoxide reductase heme-binding subunit MsrQ [Pseudomonadota bacterium]MEC8403802.1 protein-methionine-sulfoxide reductase heme-binding subunit MsrQ [Pseudomonadota bacterium]
MHKATKTLNIRSLFDLVRASVRRLRSWHIYVSLLVPLLFLTYDLLSGRLGVDPMRAIEKSLGVTAIYILILTLCITPFSVLTGINFIRFRRAFGLMSFFYIILHFSTWLLLDMQLRWVEIAESLTRKPFIVFGMMGFLLLIPLAATSNNYSMKRLGKYWQKLHKLIYVAIILGGIHYLMMEKTLQNDAIITFIIIIALISLRFFKIRKINWL